MPRFDLNVSFPEKDYAKSFGAKFDWNNKVWYYEGGKVPRGLAIFYMGPGENVEGYGEGAREGAGNGSESNTEDTTEMSVDELRGSSGNSLGESGNNSEENSIENPIENPIVNPIVNLIENPIEDIIEDIIVNGINITKALGVSEFHKVVDGVFETREFKSVCIKGEVTNFDPGRHKVKPGQVDKNHFYFDLKDKETGELLSCVIWNQRKHILSDIDLSKKPEVAVVGNFRWYTRDGSAKLHIDKIVLVGDGLFQAQYLALKKQLEDDGLFDAKYKSPLPKYPRAVGIISGDKSEAVKDVWGQIKDYTKIYYYSTQIQATGNVETVVDNILKGIEVLDKIEEVDVIVICRGGGTEEQMMTVFDNEKLVRGVFGRQPKKPGMLKTPIISAVGHSSHDPLLDGVADVIAKTPTDAGKQIVKDYVLSDEAIRNYLEKFKLRTQGLLSAKMAEYNRQLSNLNMHKPESLIKERQMLINEYMYSISNNLQTKVNENKELIRKYQDNYYRCVSGMILEKNKRVNILNQRILEQSPARRMEKYSGRLELQRERLGTNIDKLLQRKVDIFTTLQDDLTKNINDLLVLKKDEFKDLNSNLEKFSPLAKLVNGYGYISHDDQPIRSVLDAKVGDEIKVQIHDGEITAEIKNIDKKNI